LEAAEEAKAVEEAGMVAAVEEGAGARFVIIPN